MKPLFVILICLSIGAKAQTIDTSVHSFYAASINPVKATVTDTGNARWIGIKASDDLKGNAIIYFALLNKVKPTSNPVDILENVLADGSYIISGSEYALYAADKKYAFRAIAAQLGLTLK